MSIEPREILNLPDFVAYVCNVKELEDKKGKKYLKPELLFRGQSDKRYNLIPSLGRSTQPILQRERNLIEMAKYKMPHIFHDKLMPIELLALLQHHGIPTRLLDVTENALVALYFACSTNENKSDGEVIIFSSIGYDVANYPIINGIADSYRFAFGSTTHLSSFFSQITEQEYFVEQRWTHGQVTKTPENGARWIEQVCNNILFVRTKELSSRQKIQQGRYILFHNQIQAYSDFDQKCFVSSIEPIKKTHDSIIGRCIIPKEKKHEILQNLALMGMRREILFSDNIDIVCSEITKRYNN